MACVYTVSISIIIMCILRIFTLSINHVLSIYMYIL